MATKILLVEDDRIIEQDIRTTLTDEGYSVISGYPEIFKGGEEFPDNIDKMISEAGIDLVLMDINLSSQLDGIDIVKHIKLKSDIPVIFLSAISKQETVLRARETEPYAYLLKPFSPAQLCSQIAMTLQLHASTRRQKAELEKKTGLWQLSITETRIKTSFSWLCRFGFRGNEIMTEEDFFAVVHPDDIENLRLSLKLLKRKLVRRRAFEYRLICADGATRWILSKIIDARRISEQELQYTLVSMDITPQKNREETLLHDSSHDALTGLLNRKAFMEELNKLLKKTSVTDKNFALIFSDLDDFKRVNDEYGHEAGDELLRSVAGRFRQSVKKGDIVARFGGDEFAFIIRDLKKSADVHFIAQRIVDYLHQPAKVGVHSLQISISLGIAMPEAVSGTAESLLKNADQAMYRAKKNRHGSYQIFRHAFETTEAQMRS